MVYHACSQTGVDIAHKGKQSLYSPNEDSWKIVQSRQNLDAPNDVQLTSSMVLYS